MNTRLLFSLIAVSFVLAGCPTRPTKTPAPVVTRPLPGSHQTTPVQQTAEQLGPGYHTVQKDDTLYNIANRYGQSVADVMRWNNLSDSTIQIGQRLRIVPPDGEKSSTVVTQPVDVGQGGVRPLGGSDTSSGNTATYKRQPKAGKEPYSASSSPPPTGPTPVAPTVTSTAAIENLNWMWPANGQMLSGYSASNRGVDIAGKAGDPVVASADGKVIYIGTGARGFGELVIIEHETAKPSISVYAHNQAILVKEKQMVKRGQKIAEMGSTDTDRVKLHFEIRIEGSPIDPLRYLPPR